MIKVIKHGTLKYTVICKDCGCEFEYELSDAEKVTNQLINNIFYNNAIIIKCPDCGCIHVHKGETRPWTSPIATDPNNPYGDSITSTDHCATCPYKDGLKDSLGNPIVGDSPCQWCSHYKWKVTYCNSSKEN